MGDIPRRAGHESCGYAGRNDTAGQTGVPQSTHRVRAREGTRRVGRNRTVEDSTVLVLSRKIGETISVGDGIEIVVNRISGNRVTLGIKAPGNVRIVRGELDRYDGQPTFDWAAADSEMVAR